MSKVQKSYMAWLGGSGAVALVGLLVTWAVKSWGFAYSAGEAKAQLLTKPEAAAIYAPLTMVQDIKDSNVRIEKKVDQILLKAMPVYGPQQ